MGGDYGINRLIEQLQLEIGANVYQRFDKCEGTHIERIFETGLHAMSAFLGLQGVPGSIAPATFLPGSMPDDVGFGPGRSHIYFWRQYTVLDWKVDFLLGMQALDGGECYVVVECDGHEFHERTKEQAAKDRSRDRRLQDAGYRIHRYTGHELYKDPWQCVNDAMLSLLRLAEGQAR